MLLDELLGGGEDGHGVGFRHGGGVLDVLGEALEVVVAGLHGAVGGVVDALGTSRVGATHNLISYRHSTKRF